MNSLRSGTYPAATSLHRARISPVRDVVMLSAALAAFVSPAQAGAAEARGEAISISAAPKGAERTLKIVPGSGEVFSDCSPQMKCPGLVVVPDSPEGFQVGSPEIETDHRESETLHPVKIKAFAIGRTEVSVGEYMACVAAKGCAAPEWLEPGGQHNIETGVSAYYRNFGAAITGEHQPVVAVSHTDALAYTSWLAGVTDKPYRLPSETEWEYAARAGSRTAYWWGDDIRQDGKVRAACRGCGSEWDGKSLAPVGSFAPNPWGLFNVHGNVWEWVADYYCGAYATGSDNGSPRLEDTCEKKDAKGLRVLRGGSSFYEPHLLRAALRLRNFEGFRNVSVGFRVARSIP